MHYIMDAALAIREKMSQNVSMNGPSSLSISRTEERTLRTAADSDGERSPSELEGGNTSPAATVSLFDSQELISGPTITSINLSTRRPCISLQDMIATSIALKSDIDLTIAAPSSWPSGLFPKTVSSPARSNIPLPPDSMHQPESDTVPTHVSQAISFLQREVLLLRNELNVEQWLARENVKHIGRLYQNRILSGNAETEQQGLVSLPQIPSVEIPLNGDVLSNFSTINCVITEHKSTVWTLNSRNIRSRLLQSRPNLQTGTRNLYENYAKYEKKRSRGQQKPLHFGGQKKRPR
jgi:hypothetical protein